MPDSKLNCNINWRLWEYERQLFRCSFSCLDQNKKEVSVFIKTWNISEKHAFIKIYEYLKGSVGKLITPSDLKRDVDYTQRLKGHLENSNL